MGMKRVPPPAAASSGPAASSVTSPAVIRAVRVLDAVSHQGPMTIADIAQWLGLAKSSVSDLCATLVEERLLRRDADARFWPGPRLDAVAAGLAAGTTLLNRFTATCGAIPALDGQTVVLDVVQGAETMSLEVRMGRHPLPLTPRPGTSVRTITSASGQAVLSALGPETAEELFRRFAAHQGFPAPSDPARPAVNQGQAAQAGAACVERPNGVIEIAHAVPREEGEDLPLAVVIHVPAQEDTPVNRQRLEQAAVRLATALKEP
jgi:DNA-binding IclR family transcriptional regulator